MYTQKWMKSRLPPGMAMKAAKERGHAESADKQQPLGQRAERGHAVLERIDVR